MKTHLTFLLIFLCCLINYSAVAETTEVPSGGVEIEVGGTSPKILELRNKTGKVIKDVWVQVVNGDNTKITKLNIFEKDGTDMDDKVDDDNDGKLQAGENDNDFPAGGVTKGRTILTNDKISSAEGKRDFKLIIHFNPMDDDVKIKVILSVEDNTGYHNNVCMNTPINDGAGLLTVPSGNDLITTDLVNDGILPITTVTVSCPVDMYIFESLHFEGLYENSIVTLQNDMAVIELNPYLQPHDSAAMFCTLSNWVDNDTELQFISEVSLENIPTLSEWGVIILLLLTLAVGMVFLYQRQPAMAVAGGAEISNAKPHLFNRKLFTKVFAITLLIGFAGMLGAYLWFGQITSADPLGVFVSAAVVAYMVQLHILKKEGRG